MSLIGNTTRRNEEGTPNPSVATRTKMALVIGIERKEESIAIPIEKTIQIRLRILRRESLRMTTSGMIPSTDGGAVTGQMMTDMGERNIVATRSRGLRRNENDAEEASVAARATVQVTVAIVEIPQGTMSGGASTNINQGIHEMQRDRIE